MFGKFTPTNGYLVQEFRFDKFECSKLWYKRQQRRVLRFMLQGLV